MSKWSKEAALEEIEAIIPSANQIAFTAWDLRST
jgi:hypothetical protein